MEQHSRTITLTCPPASTGTVLGGLSELLLPARPREAGCSAFDCSCTLSCVVAVCRRKVNQINFKTRAAEKSCRPITRSRSAQLHGYNERNGSTRSPFRALTALHGESRHRSIRSESNTMKCRPILQKN